MATSPYLGPLDPSHIVWRFELDPLHQRRQGIQTSNVMSAVRSLIPKSGHPNVAMTFRDWGSSKRRLSVAPGSHISHPSKASRGNVGINLHRRLNGLTNQRNGFRRAAFENDVPQAPISHHPKSFSSRHPSLAYLPSVPLCPAAFVHRWRSGPYSQHTTFTTKTTQPP